MTIYKLIQTRYSDGKFTDFDLPKTHGYFSTQHLALTHRDRLLSRQLGAQTDWDTPEDFRIQAIEVHDK